MVIPYSKNTDPLNLFVYYTLDSQVSLFLSMCHLSLLGVWKKNKLTTRTFKKINIKNKLRTMYPENHENFTGSDKQRVYSVCENPYKFTYRN